MNWDHAKTSYKCKSRINDRRINDALLQQDRVCIENFQRKKNCLERIMLNSSLKFGFRYLKEVKKLSWFSMGRYGQFFATRELIRPGPTA